MGTGKYRITKIPREWNDKNKIVLKRVIRDGKVEFVNEKDNKNIDTNVITDFYYKKVLLNNNSKFLGTKNQFIFKTNKMERNLDEKNKCVIMGDYAKEKFLKCKETYGNVCVKRIEVVIQNKKCKKRKICREFFENEKEIMKRRYEKAIKFNGIFYSICRKIYNLKYEEYSDKKIYEIFENEINFEDLKKLKEAFKQQENGLETNELLRMSFNKKRENILLEFIQKLNEEDFKNEEELKKWFSSEGSSYCKKIFKIYSDMSQKEKYYKLLRHGKSDNQKKENTEEEKKETLQRRLKLGDHSSYDMKKYYQKEYKQVAIENLSQEKNPNEIKNRIKDIVNEGYKLEELCEKIENLLKNFNDGLDIIIFQIKEHYRNKVNRGEKIISDEEKYLLSQIHSYIKGRYKKLKKLQNVDLKEEIKKNFDLDELKGKIEKSILNKVNNYRIFEMKLKNPHIESSDDLEILKAEETFLSKISTAVSKAGYTLNILLEVPEDKDILEINNAVYEHWKNKNINEIVSKIYKIYSESELPKLESKDDKLLKGMILYIQGIRQEVFHPDKLLGKNDKNKGVNHLNFKKKETIVTEFENKVSNNGNINKNYNEGEIKKYFEEIEKKMSEYFIEKYESNNIFKVYSEDIYRIIELINDFSFNDNGISYLFPKFHKVYRRLELERKDEKVEVARKYLLQTIYYYYFQYEIERNKENIEKYNKIYRNELENRNNGKKVYSHIEGSFNNDIEILYENIQRKGSLENNLRKINNEWIEFITIQFQNFLKEKKLEKCVLSKSLEYKEKEKLEDEAREKIRKILKDKMDIRKVKYSDDAYAFISLSQFLDLREISNLNHDIKKFIQFRDKNREKYEISANEKYIKELRNISYILRIMLEHKDRVIQKSYLESYEEDISIIFGKDIIKEEIKDLKIKIKNEKEEIVTQSLYRQGKEESNSWITLYGITQAKRNGTFEFFKDFFENNSDIKLCKEDIEEYEKLYNKKEKNQKIVDEYISSQSQDKTEKDEIKKSVKEANDNNKLFHYYKNMIYGDSLKRGYDFINDIYSHYLGWIRKIERDFEVYNLKRIKEKELRHPIAHFDYFKKTDKSLLDYLNDFYLVFDYSIKYQKDAQRVINNIFEKYQVVREDGAPVVFFCKEQGKFKLSKNLVPKKHGKYPEIKLIHEKYVEFFKRIFEYKK